MHRPAPETASIAAGAASALGASTCCVLPFVLVSMGLGGAWVAALAFGYAFYRLYLRPAPCGPDLACTPATRRHQRVAFWTTLVSAKAILLAPFYVPLLPG